MNFKRIGRCLVCLLLVCALMVNISPVKAKAAASTVLIPAGIALGAILLGIGIAGASDSGSEVIDDVITSAQTFLEDTTSWITDGMVTAYLTGDNTKPYAFPVSLIEALFGWVWDSEIISGGPCSKYTTLTLPLSPIGSNVTFVGDFPFAMFAYGLYVNSSRTDCCFVFVSDSWKNIVSDNNQTFPMHKEYDSVKVSAWSSSQSYWSTSPWGLPYLGVFQNAEDAMKAAVVAWSGSDVTTDKDLTLGEVASAGSTFADGYATWNEGAITIPEAEIDDGPVVVVPTGIATVPNAGQELTQADVWSGLGTYVDTGGDLDPGGSDDTQTSGDLFTDVTVTTFLAKLFADLTRALFGESTMTLTELFGSVMTEIQLLGKTFIEEIAKLLEGLQTSFQTLTDSISQIWDKAVTALLDGIKALFAPSDTFISTKVNELMAKYGYLDTFLALGTDLKLYFASLGMQPPIIYIDLGAGSGFYPMGGKTVFVDLTWYADYKGTVDTILGGLIWLWLVWRVFLSIPGIIFGQSGIWGAPKNDIGAGSTALSVPEWRKEG